MGRGHASAGREAASAGGACAPAVDVVEQDLPDEGLAASVDEEVEDGVEVADPVDEVDEADEVNVPCTSCVTSQGFAFGGSLEESSTESIPRVGSSVPGHPSLTDPKGPEGWSQDVSSSSS